MFCAGFLKSTPTRYGGFMEPKRFWSTLLGAAALVAAVGLLAPLVGSSSIDLGRAFAGKSPDAEIFFQARLPRVVMALLAGSALAVSGVLFQALLRDSLATPYTLGVSSGAALGAVAAIVFGWQEVLSTPAVWFCSFVGAGLTLVLVLAIAAEGRRVSSFTLLLAGVTINSICIALILFLQSATTFGRSLTVSRWLMGGIDAESYGALAGLAAVLIPVMIFVTLRARQWNLIAVGEDWAAARGVSTRRALLEGFLAGSLLTGSITAFTGPIGFVGLIVPHALRLRLGADHRLLVPASALFGGAFLVLCDSVARIATAPADIPVGVITAMLGGPFFIWLLKSRRRSLWL